MHVGLYRWFCKLQNEPIGLIIEKIYIQKLTTKLQTSHKTAN